MSSASARRSDRVGRNDACPCGSGLKAKRCHGVGLRGPSSSAEESGSAPTVQADAGRELTMFGETEDGMFIRTISPASPLPEGQGGIPAEQAIRSAAATWALPDFVYDPVKLEKGLAQREVGDGILLCGGLGLILQVKHREVPTENRPREDSWLRAAVAKATRQINGSHATLLREQVVLHNHRGWEVPIPEGIEWVGAVVIDHPAPPTLKIEPLVRLPTLVLLRRDWEFLYEQLRSTHAVVSYVRRAVADGAVQLGEEPVRYYQLANADLHAPAEPSHVPGYGRQESRPLLPLRPVDVEDDEGSFLFRQVMEDIATTPGHLTRADRLQLLAELDQLPVTDRADDGRHLHNFLQEATDLQDERVLWNFRQVLLRPPAPHLMFGVCNQLNDLTREALRQWVTLRHHEYGARIEDFDLPAVAVLLTPRRDGRRPWDSTILSIRGNLGLTDDKLETLGTLWNPAPSA